MKKKLKIKIFFLKKLKKEKNLKIQIKLNFFNLFKIIIDTGDFIIKRFLKFVWFKQRWNFTFFTTIA